MDLPPPKLDFLPGHGELAELVRTKDWAATPLGPMERWPQSLRTTVSLCLASNFPINIIWGPEAVQIYNDGYRVICGEAHPRALGEPYPVTWASAWPAIGEPFRQALEDKTRFLENQRMFLTRNGYLEETFFTFSLSAIRDESGGVGGLFHPVTETTRTMLAERRTRALRDLTAALAAADTAHGLVEVAARTLSAFDFDLPFLVFYGFDDTHQAYRRLGCQGISDSAAAAPEWLPPDADAPWPVGRAIADRRMHRVEDAAERFAGGPCGPYPEPPHDVFLMPVAAQGADHPPLLVVAGASSRLPLDESYRGFFDLLAAAFAAALATVRAREDERKRLDALAAIDRAKTAFFSNVSHEFRTPLTLLLGPLDDIRTAEGLPPGLRDNAETAHRNGLRLMKLVNGLLDFSRVEAGRAQARFEPVDLAAYTAELASNFRSATDRAGLALVVDAPTLPEPVHIDRGMWETVLLNLLSNAFKFTYEGGIAVSVRPDPDGQSVSVAVRDTGTGIPPAALPRLFERFYRVENAAGRSFEGSGIGLSLVGELVALHGGRVDVDSLPGRGTTFTVTLPLGTGHLPAGWQAADAAATHAKRDAFVLEALSWLPDAADGEPVAAAPAAAAGRPARVLLADDNGDMRSYVRRLLEEHGFAVEAVANGAEALAAARAERPDLVITDVMMPRMTGFELLAELRADPQLQDVMVVLLSARAGEEARVEGLEAGADDYLVKPFSSRELMARVVSLVTLARERRATVEEASRAQQAALAAGLELQVLEQSRERGKSWQLSADLLAVVDAAGRLERVNPAWERMLGWTAADLEGRPLLDRIHPDDRAESATVWRRAQQQGRSIAQFENRCLSAAGDVRWISWIGIREDGRVYCSGRDVTLERQRAHELEIAQESLRHSQKMEAVGQLTGGVAHDFNNLLTVIRGSVELLKRPGLPEEKRTRYIEAIAGTVTRAAKLTGQLLAFARRQTLQPVVFDVCDSTTALHEMLGTVVGAQVALTVETRAGPLYVNADPTQLDAALVNMAVNARDAMPSGGRLSISVGTADRLPAGRRHRGAGGPYVAIALSDTGTGIPEERLEQIFEPFFTTKPPGHGTGLGLSQVFGFAQQSGGDVRVDSAPGRGATFTLYLPRVDAPADAPRPGPAADDGMADGGGARVLVVEDNPDIGPFVARALAEAGFDVVLETNGAAALQRLERDSGFRIVFSDVVMPGMSGLEFGAAVRARYPALPVILASGYSHVMATSGPQGFELLHKPYSMEELTRVLWRHLQTPSPHRTQDAAAPAEGG